MIANMEVAVAKCTGILIMRVNIGTSSAPPPIPSNPDAIPARKLRLPASRILREGLRKDPPDLEDSLSASSAAERLLLILNALTDIGMAMKAMTKNPKETPRRFAGTLVVKYAPKSPPGTVAKARSRPAL